MSPGPCDDAYAGLYDQNPGTYCVTTEAHKQWGGVQKEKAGRILEGRTWDEMPVMAKA
jgi:protein gp37